LDKTALNDNIDQAIEGIVFRFGDIDSEEDPILAKMVDPVFTQLAKDKAGQRTRKEPSDFLGIALVDVMNFILEKGVSSFSVEGEAEDERYISFMSDVFVNFLEEYAERYKGIDFQEPEYLKREEFKLNKDLINDERVEALIEGEESFESLFKLMLNSFRKIRKRASGVITKDVIEHFNSVVKEIDSYIEKDRGNKKVQESNVPSFSNFRANVTDKKVDYVTEEDDGEDDIFYSFNEFRTAMETIEEQDDTITEKTKSKNPINIIIGRMQPFHKGHLKMAKLMKEENKHNTFIAVVHPGNNKSGKSPFDIETVRKYMDAVVAANDEIEGYEIFNRGFLGNVLAKLDEKGYAVNLLGCGEDRKTDYIKQEEYLKNTELSGLLGDKFKIFDTPRTASGTDVRAKLADDNFSAFRKLTTPEISSLFNMLSPMVKSKINEVETNIDPMLLLNETVEQMQDLGAFLGREVSKEERKKQVNKMKKIIADFNTFRGNKKKGAKSNIKLDKSLISTMDEAAGFGTQPFFIIKKDERVNYFFAIEKDNKDSASKLGVHLQFGNYSEYEAIEGPKNSYFVMSMCEMSLEVMQDLSRDVGEVPLISKEKILVSDNEISRLYRGVSKCMLDHLENEPKTTRIYDELKANLEFDGNYIEYMRSIVISYLGEEWNVQEGSDENLVIIAR